MPTEHYKLREERVKKKWIRNKQKKKKKKKKKKARKYLGGSEVLQYFGSGYIIWLKQFKVWKVPVALGSMVVVGALTRCELVWFGFFV